MGSHIRHVFWIGELVAALAVTAAAPVSAPWTSTNGLPDVTVRHGLKLHVTGVVTGSNLP
jgi:hypothetical protein